MHLVNKYSKLSKTNIFIKVKAMRGTSSEAFILKRAGGRCEPVNNTCESLLEQDAERPSFGASKYLRRKTVIFFEVDSVCC